MTLGILDLLSLAEGGATAINPTAYVPISFPLELPQPWPPLSFQMSGSVAAAIAQSPFTYAMQVQQNPGEYWTAQVTFPPFTRAQAENWISFFLILNGPCGTFMMGDPQGVAARGTAAGSPKVSGAGQSGHSVLTSGWALSSFGVLVPGDYLQLGQRLHKVLRTVDSDGSGFARIDIWPRIRETPNDGDSVVIQNPRGIWRLNTSSMSLWSVGNDDYYSIGFSAFEAL